MTRKADIWMPLYIGDYLSDTMHLTAEQHGAYLLAIMAYWKNGGPLPVESMATICHLTGDAWSNAQAMLAQFFNLESKPSFWVHNRVEAELAKARKNKQGAVSKAITAAQARWGKNNSNASSNASSNAPGMPQAMLEGMLERCPSPSPILYTPLPPQEGEKPGRKKSSKKPAIEFKTFLADCKAKGEKPISDYKPTLAYAQSISLPDGFLELCWNEFYRRHQPGGVSETKRRSDWRRTFRNCLEGNWYKLWWHNAATGQYELTTAGRTAEKVAA
ncbi:MAG: DUF1376 domain-containing protein [Proteobacteria bacterium]|nr:DUF1376 domain-containing protein [Pseudomonadota bacterium]